MVGVEVESLTSVVDYRTLSKLVSIKDNDRHPFCSTLTKQKSMFRGTPLLFTRSTDRLRRSFLPRTIQHFNATQKGCLGLFGHESASLTFCPAAFTHLYWLYEQLTYLFNSSQNNYVITTHFHFHTVHTHIYTRVNVFFKRGQKKKKCPCNGFCESRSAESPDSSTGPTTVLKMQSQN